MIVTIKVQLTVNQGSTLTKSSLSDFYLPERKIYLPKNNNTEKNDKHYYFSLILTNKVCV